MDQGGLEVSLRRNSTWTPKNHKPSRDKVFEERLILLDKWYSGWSKEQRRIFLEHVLMKCTIDQLLLIDSYVHPQVPEPPADFTRLFPRHVTFRIFSFLDPRSLCRATQVCWYWHYLTEENCIWKEKCLRFGWTLPSSPLPTDMGTWKRHYLSCVRNLHWVPPSPAKSIVTQEEQGEMVITTEHRDQPLPVNRNNITSEDKSQTLPISTMASSRKKPASRMNKWSNKRREGTFSFSRNDSTLQDKPVWKHPDRYPKNLEQSTILTTSWLRSQHSRYYHPSLSTGNLQHTLSPIPVDNENTKQMSLHDEEDSLTESEISEHPRDAMFPRLSLPNNLSDRKTVGQINRSELYRSLLQRTGASHDSTTPPKTDTTQQNSLSLNTNQVLPKDTENTVQLTTNPWPIKLDYDSSDNDT